MGKIFEIIENGFRYYMSICYDSFIELRKIYYKLKKMLKKSLYIITRYDNRAFVTSIFSIILDGILIYFFDINEFIIITILYQISLILSISKHTRELEDNIYYYRYELFDALKLYGVTLQVKTNEDLNYVFVLTKNDKYVEIVFTENLIHKPYVSECDDTFYKNLLNIIEEFSHVVDTYGESYPNIEID